jgi:hypothetical protein
MINQERCMIAGPAWPAINVPVPTGQDATAIAQDSRGDCIEKGTTTRRYLL